MCFGDLAQALALLPVTLDPLAVELQRTTSDGAAFELGSPHAGTDPLDDQAAFQLSDRSDDDHDSSAQRAASVDLLSEADELDVQPVQIVKDVEEVPGGACDPVARPDQDNVELTAARQVNCATCSTKTSKLHYLKGENLRLGW